MDLSLANDYLTERVVALETQLASRTGQYQQALQTIQRLEAIVGKAARIATHVAYLCSTLPERSTDIESATDQLHVLLTTRQG